MNKQKEEIIRKEEEKNGFVLNSKGEYTICIPDFVDNFLKENKIKVFDKEYCIYKNNIWESLDKRNLGRMIKNQICRIEPSAYKKNTHLDIEHHIRHSVDEIKLLNIYPFKMNFINGVFNYKTLNIEKHDENNYFDYIFPYDLNLEANIPTPHFDKFISETFQNDEEMISYILYLIGYWISGVKTRQNFYILHGKGCNGKSLLIWLIENLVGEDFVMTVPISNINDRFALGHAFGKKIISSSENEDNGKAIGTQIIKGLTGNDRLGVERKFKDGKTVKLSVELIFSVNNILKFKDTSDGFKRRVEVIPFGNKVINPDASLPQKLEGEIKGIMTKVIKAYIKGTQNGITCGQKIKDTTQEYLKRAIQGNDDASVHEFFDNYVIEKDKGRVNKADLYGYFFNKTGYPNLISEETFWKIFRKWASINEIEIIEKRNGIRFIEGIHLLKEQDDNQE
ncbi:MAG: DNA primase family protein [Clostridium chrysemydis]|uniref:DNA primase family protein n=1 Tax=Clostridium chrysemydis TaxID=2665504 RepID=UPI003F321EA4